MTDNVLIVEGNADVFFFDALIREWNLPSVEVSPPASVSRANGKFHAIATLDVYVKQLLDDSIRRLAIVVDADTPLDDQSRGLAVTLAAIDRRMNSHGFSRTSCAGGGFVYTPRASKKTSQVFLWVMPDSITDGSLEDFVRIQVPDSGDQSDWYKRARDTVAALDTPLFNRQAHELKAITSTWLAWQRYPGKGMQSVVGDRLIDLESGLASQLRSWLSAAFK